MNKLWTIFVVAALLLGSVSVAWGDSFVGEVTTNGANLRAGGSMVHHTVARLSSGTKVVVTKRLGDWYVVRIPKHIPVYIIQRYVRVENGDMGMITGDRVNLRCSPDTKYGALGITRRGTQVRILGRSGDWLKIEPPQSCVGWMYKSHLKNVGSVGQVEVDAPYRAKREESSKKNKAEQALLNKVKATYDAGSKAFMADNLERAMELFGQAAREGQDTPYADAASYQLQMVKNKIEAKKALEEKQRRLQRRQAELEEKLVRDLLSLYKQALAEVKPKKPAYTAVGTLKGLGMMVLRRGTHKLIDSDGTELYVLRSAKNTNIDLYDSTYFEKKVGIVGKVLEAPGYGKIIEVQRIDILE